MILSKKEARELVYKSHGNKPQKTDDKKLIWISILILFCCIAPGYFFFAKYILWPISLSDLSYLILLLPGIAVCILFYNFKTKVPKSKRSIKKLAQLENLLELESKAELMRAFGRYIYGKLCTRYSPIIINQINLCNELLNFEQVSNHKNISFFIYLKLYKFYLIDENITRAIDALNSALKIKPNDVLLTVFLAEAFEEIGDGEKAIQKYQEAFSLSTYSNELSIYFDSQVERLKKNGPQKGALIKGLRYMTY